MEGKNIVVLGADSDLGIHITEEFANHGFKPFLIVRSEETLNPCMTALKEKDIDADYQIADFTNRESIESALSVAQQKTGSIDVLVYNAVLFQGGLPSELTLEDCMRCLDIRSNVSRAAEQVVPCTNGTILFIDGGLTPDMMPGPIGLSLSTAMTSFKFGAVALRKKLEGTEVYTRMVKINGGIGLDDYYSPEKIAAFVYRLHEERRETETEIIYDPAS